MPPHALQTNMPATGPIVPLPATPYFLSPDWAAEKYSEFATENVEQNEPVWITIPGPPGLEKRHVPEGDEFFFDDEYVHEEEAFAGDYADDEQYDAAAWADFEAKHLYKRGNGPSKPEDLPFTLYRPYRKNHLKQAPPKQSAQATPEDVEEPYLAKRGNGPSTPREATRPWRRRRPVPSPKAVVEDEESEAHLVKREAVHNPFKNSPARPSRPHPKVHDAPSLVKRDPGNKPSKPCCTYMPKWPVPGEHVTNNQHEEEEHDASTGSLVKRDPGNKPSSPEPVKKPANPEPVKEPSKPACTYRANHDSDASTGKLVKREALPEADELEGPSLVKRDPTPTYRPITNSPTKWPPRHEDEEENPYYYLSKRDLGNYLRTPLAAYEEEMKEAVERIFKREALPGNSGSKPEPNRPVPYRPHRRNQKRTKVDEVDEVEAPFLVKRDPTPTYRPITNSPTKWPPRHEEDVEEEAHLAKREEAAQPTGLGARTPRRLYWVPAEIVEAHFHTPSLVKRDPTPTYRPITNSPTKWPPRHQEEEEAEDFEDAPTLVKRDPSPTYRPITNSPTKWPPRRHEEEEEDEDFQDVPSLVKRDPTPTYRPITNSPTKWPPRQELEETEEGDFEAPSLVKRDPTPTYRPITNSPTKWPPRRQEEDEETEDFASLAKRDEYIDEEEYYSAEELPTLVKRDPSPTYRPITNSPTKWPPRKAVFEDDEEESRFQDAPSLVKRDPTPTYRPITCSPTKWPPRHQEEDDETEQFGCLAKRAEDVDEQEEYYDAPSLVKRDPTPTYRPITNSPTKWPPRQEEEEHGRLGPRGYYLTEEEFHVIYDSPTLVKRDPSPTYRPITNSPTRWPPRREEEIEESEELPTLVKRDPSPTYRPITNSPTKWPPRHEEEEHEHLARRGFYLTEEEILAVQAARHAVLEEDAEFSPTLVKRDPSPTYRPITNSPTKWPPRREEEEVEEYEELPTLVKRDPSPTYRPITNSPTKWPPRHEEDDTESEAHLAKRDSQEGACNCDGFSAPLDGPERSILSKRCNCPGKPPVRPHPTRSPNNPHCVISHQENPIDEDSEQPNLHKRSPPTSKRGSQPTKSPMHPGCSVSKRSIPQFVKRDDAWDWDEKEVYPDFDLTSPQLIFPEKITTAAKRQPTAQPTGTLVKRDPTPTYRPITNSPTRWPPRHEEEDVEDEGHLAKRSSWFEEYTGVEKKGGDAPAGLDQESQIHYEKHTNVNKVASVTLPKDCDPITRLCAGVDSRLVDALEGSKGQFFDPLPRDGATGSRVQLMKRFIDSQRA
ncbi:hypothetical protein BJ508DRAFT_330928 [Ascobolus immersus RN42]|uniref:Uncharacterized protein n=1 Tax=Ascobolus immersus RN42 TaxID=1160509 RepID=A0A3N4HXH7_ASCIM|nr:hypothetical protein BJ508DRAFT_330928 [Ascobolus immersus RN42]